MSVIKVGLSALALVLMAGNALAQEKGCILLKSVAENEIVSKDAQGNETTRVVPVDKIVPGDEVIYRISATNICDQPAENVVIDNAVPEHMNYVAKSAVGPSTDISYSVDGGFNYGKPEALSMTNADGSKRPARPDDYTNIRWVMRNPLKPGSVAFVQYRAILE